MATEDVGNPSSDDESLNYEDNSDLESTIEKLRQLLSNRGPEDSISSDDTIQSPSAKKTEGKFAFNIACGNISCKISR